MLIGTRAFHRSQLDAMQRLSGDIAFGQGQIASGRRWSSASEAPAAAQQSAALVRRQSDNARYALGIDFAEQRLTIADGALEGMSSAMIRVRELALQASSDTSSTADRSILALEARELLNVVVSLGNTQDASGNYLFAGARAAEPAFGFDAAGRVEYRGLGRAAPIAVAAQARVDAAVPGPELFGALPGAAGQRSVFAIVEDFVAVLEAPPPAAGDLAAIAAFRLELGRAVDGAELASERLATSRATFGGRLNRLESDRDRLASIGEGLTIARSRLEDTDLAATITNLQRASLVLEATQRSFARVTSLSLFDELG